MKINEIISYLETIANTSLQEEYDNAGLITGNTSWDCTGVICTLDATEDVVNEAIEKKCNLIVAHHPIVFKGLKKINGKNYVEKTIIAAIKNDIAIYAIHTNLDNVKQGVNGRIAQMLELENCKILSEKDGTLNKLFTFVPVDHAAKVRNAIFAAGGGQISNYSECSFNAEGVGTFKGGKGTNPFVGEPGKHHQEKDKFLRKVAEFDNFKRRNAKERIEMIQTAGRDVITDMLDVLDDCDRAQKQIEISDDSSSINEGVLLVFNKLRNTLQARGLKPMETIGEEFNADLHEAVTEIPAPTKDLIGKVVDEILKGYYLNDKIIRHAKVVVGK